VKRAAAFLLAGLAAGAASAQTLYRCTSAQGAVTYQSLPCGAGAAQKPVGQATPRKADEGARRALERDARRGDPLARGFVDELEVRDYHERLEREERLRKEREEAAKRPPPEPEWNPPWGWPGPPGLARPKPAPAR